MTEGAGDSPGDRNTYVRTEFLERVAHELRGPAGVTLGALDELELLMAEGSKDTAALLAMARRGVRRVLHTAERLQRTGWLERGDVQWAFVPVDLELLVHNAVRSAEQLEARRGVVVTTAGPEVPTFVHVDEPWMSLALAELVMNALAHARRAVHVASSATDDGVEISVTDDGAGFAGAPPPRFHPPRALRGLGLSLSLAGDVVMAHGGAIDLDVADDGTFRGARVRFLVPARAATPTDPLLRALASGPALEALTPTPPPPPPSS